MQHTKISCALRALMLCDGQVLEDELHELTVCLCLLEERSEENDEPQMLDVVRRYRALLVSRLFRDED